MPLTYPETTTFRWEGDLSHPVPYAIDFLKHSATQGGSKARQESFKATARALEELSERFDKPHFTGNQIKKLLIAAAHDHGWWQRKKREVPNLKAPEPGMKVCFRCTQAKPMVEFMTRPTPARARSYGWKEDTTQKVVGQLCSVCRKAKADEQGRKRQRRNTRRLQQSLSPEAAKVFKQYHTLRSEIARHMARVAAARQNAKNVISDPFGDGSDLVEYNYASPDMKEFYETKRLLLLDARDRLEQLFADGKPLPNRWGMLLSHAEQNNLASLHGYACAGHGARRLPTLW